MKRSIISAFVIGFIAFAAHAEDHKAGKSAAPQGMGKTCNPACTEGTHCVDGQCVDSATKKDAAPATGTTTTPKKK